MKSVLAIVLLTILVVVPPAFAAPMNGPAAPGAPTAVSLSSPYTQNFDTLANTGTANAWADDNTLAGWYSTRTTYRADTGSSNTGALIERSTMPTSSSAFSRRSVPT